MNILENRYAKKQLLDILAYMLWENKAAEMFGPSYAMFCTELYQDIVKEIKSTIAKKQKAALSFEEIDLKCRYLGEVFALEKRLETIEEKMEQTKTTIV